MPALIWFSAICLAVQLRLTAWRLVHIVRGMFAFREQFSSLLDASGLTQEELASKLSVTVGTVNRWKQGHQTPSLEQLVAIAQYFEVSLDRLALGTSRSGAEAAQ